MKRIISFVLIFAILLTGCVKNTNKTANENTTSEQIGEIAETETSTEYSASAANLSDAEFISYIEDIIYDDLVEEINSDEYFIENVSAIYVSKEQLEEMEYNSRENVFFGYSLSDLNMQFEGNKFVFTVNDKHETVVEEMQILEEADFRRIIKNIAIGTGVILVCVTVSVVTAGSVPAVSMIFASAASSATKYALSAGVISGVASGIVTGIQTGDFDKALYVAAVQGSEGFKWGAISGAIAGGTKEAIGLKGATRNGLTMNETAKIQRESKYPLDVIKQFKSMEQYNICKKAGLTPKMINGKMALVRDIDPNRIDPLTGKTNKQLMELGKAPYDNAGNKYQLHHIGQKNNSTLAILRDVEHTQNGSNKIWHDVSKVSEIDRPAFDKIREEFWKAMAKIY